VCSAAVEIDLAIHWSHLGLRGEGMPGFIARAGRHGVGNERPRQLRPSLLWAWKHETSRTILHFGQRRQTHSTKADADFLELVW
jgi:hypothetical protein